MTTSYATLSENLQEFYDFTDKVILLVGAGTGTLLSSELPIKKLIAVDQRGDALADSKEKLSQIGAPNSLEIIPAQFESVFLFADVVYFEFSLHEIADPKLALTRARGMAPDVVVFDHAPNSDWAFHAGEDQMVRRSSLAMKRLGIRRRKLLQVEQRFADYLELFSKIGAQGPIAARRANPYLGAKDIIIPMRCQLVLL